MYCALTVDCIDCRLYSIKPTKKRKDIFLQRKEKIYFSVHGISSKYVLFRIVPMDDDITVLSI